MIVYTFLRFGHRENKECASLESALSQAMDDLTNKRAAPVSITDGSKILMDARSIMKRHAEHIGVVDGDEQPLN